MFQDCGRGAAALPVRAVVVLFERPTQYLLERLASISVKSVHQTLSRRAR